MYSIADGEQRPSPNAVILSEAKDLLFLAA